LEVQLSRSRESTSAMVKQLQHYEAQLQAFASLVEENNKVKTENESLLRVQKVADMEHIESKLDTSQNNVVNNDDMVSFVARLAITL
jgi:regulator of replication initiation timing